MHLTPTPWHFHTTSCSVVFFHCPNRITFLAGVQPLKIHRLTLGEINRATVAKHNVKKQKNEFVIEMQQCEQRLRSMAYWQQQLY